jgi:hypothetical protein
LSLKERKSQGRHHQGREQEMVMPHFQTRTMGLSLGIPPPAAEAHGHQIVRTPQHLDRHW